MYVDDLSDAIIFLKNSSQSMPINIGTSREITIRDLTYKIKNIVGFKGEIIFDEKPDGATRKVLDNSRINFVGEVR